ncbi:MAG: diaminobutyrate acetyltransferase [Planctomycetales bacterium]|nr:diaminobutyrate acetyltransferase [Planctomycetales bacterium]
MPKQIPSNDISDPNARSLDGVRFRCTNVSDGAKIHAFVQDSGVLELNSCYAYLLLCKHFSETCLIAEQDDTLIGIVLGYLVPNRSDSLFVWQIGIDKRWRGFGLGRQLLTELTRQEACRHVRFLEATIAPSNTASANLFRSFAKQKNAPVVVQPGFTKHDFQVTPETLESFPHEPEKLFRIGPW